MNQQASLIGTRLKTPRAAAIAGILFSVLLITGLLLFRLSVRADPLETGTWLRTSSNRVALALNLVPFAGIAFLWFIGANDLAKGGANRPDQSNCVPRRIGHSMRNALIPTFAAWIILTAITCGQVAPVSPMTPDPMPPGSISPIAPMSPIAPISPIAP